MPTTNNNPNKKEWYKKGWGIVLAILFWPYFLVWYAWAKSSWSKGAKIAITAFVGVFVILVLSAMTSTDTTQTAKTNTAKPSEQKASQPKQEAPKDISLSDAEEVCQDANFLQNYLNLKDTSIVTLSYNPYLGNSKGTEKQLIWNGKNKTNDKVISFICDVDYKDDEIVVIGLTIDGVGVMGTAREQDQQGAKQ